MIMLLFFSSKLCLDIELIAMILSFPDLLFFSLCFLLHSKRCVIVWNIRWTHIVLKKLLFSHLFGFLSLFVYCIIFWILSYFFLLSLLNVLTIQETHFISQSHVFQMLRCHLTFSSHIYCIVVQKNLCSIASI